MRFIYTKAFKSAFLIFILAAFLVIADAKGYINSVKNLFYQTSGVLTKKIGRTTSSIKDFFYTFVTIRNLSRENALFEQKINELSFENARLKATKEENFALRRALEFSEKSELKLIPAEVDILDPTGFTQTIVINKGNAEGVKIGSAVVVSPGILIGKVSELYQNSSKVTLITDPAMVTNGEVADSGARGLVQGEHGLGLTFNLITQNEVIKSGDKVITAGLSNDLPRGLLIGEIVSIRSSASELFQKAFITPAADLRNLRFLFAVL